MFNYLLLGIANYCFLFTTQCTQLYSVGESQILQDCTKALLHLSFIRLVLLQIFD